MGREYPKAVYLKGGATKVLGRHINVRTPTELAAAKKRGYHEADELIAAAPKKKKK